MPTVLELCMSAIILSGLMALGLVVWDFCQAHKKWYHRLLMLVPMTVLTITLVITLYGLLHGEYHELALH
jgi:hypothetical protein